VLCQVPLMSCLSVAYTVTPSAGIETVVEVAVVPPELYRFAVPWPSVPSHNAYSVAPVPFFQVKVWLDESVPDDGVSVAGVTPDV